MWKETKTNITNINKYFEKINIDLQIAKMRGVNYKGYNYIFIDKKTGDFGKYYYNKENIKAMINLINNIEKELEKETIYIIENFFLFESSYYIKAVGEQEALDKWYDLYGDGYFKDINEFKIADNRGDMIVYELSYD